MKSLICIVSFGREFWITGGICEDIDWNNFGWMKEKGHKALTDLIFRRRYGKVHIKEKKCTMQLCSHWRGRRFRTFEIDCWCTIQWDSRNMIEFVGGMLKEWTLLLELLKRWGKSPTFSSDVTNATPVTEHHNHLWLQWSTLEGEEKKQYIQSYSTTVWTRSSHDHSLFHGRMSDDTREEQFIIEVCFYQESVLTAESLDTVRILIKKSLYSL